MPQQLAALFSFCVIDTLGFGILIPLVPYMAERFGTATQFITPVLGSYSLCQLLAAPWWGRLSDRYGRRPVLMSSLAGACASYVLLGCAQNIWWLLASRMLAGGDPRSANFTLPAAVSVLMSLLAILLVRFVLPESHSAAHRQQHPDESRRGAWRLLRTRHALALLAVATLIVTYSQSILESIFAIWALHRYGFGPRAVGFLLFAVALPALLMQGGLVRLLAPRLGEGRLASLGVLAYVAGLGLLANASTLAVTLGGLLLCGVGLGAYNPSASALASRQSRAQDRGAVMGAYVASASLARVLGPFSSGLLYAALGPGAPFLVGACVTLPAAWLVRRAAAIT